MEHEIKLPQEIERQCLIGIPVVKKLTGFSSKTPIYKRIQEGTFPAQITLSGRCSRWRLGDILDWCASQK